MYFIILLFTALFLVSIFGLNWPIKLVHYIKLKKLAVILNASIKQNSLLSPVFAEIITSRGGKPISIRYHEGSVDSLQASSGLEIRVKHPFDVVLEIYRAGQNKQEWGDFKRFVSGDERVDQQFYMITTSTEKAAAFWEHFASKKILADYSVIQQISVLNQEMVFHLKHLPSTAKFLELLDTI